MTMQVGMVGTDGVLIASDTQWTNTPQLRVNEDWFGARGRYNANKIIVSHERGLAISSARSMETAGTIADKIISDLNDEDFQYPQYRMEEIGKNVLDSVIRPERRHAQCLVAISRPVPQLFLLSSGTLNDEFRAMCRKMDSYAIAGDNLSAAIFWAERYYEKLPLENLIPLAAHLICVAHKLNTAMISGLEVVLCTASGIRRLSDESVKQLELKANKRDKKIGKLLLNHREQFTYTPDVAG